MPALGARCQDRAAPQDHGGHGSSLGRAHHRGRRRSHSRAALIGFFHCVVERSLACQAKPHLRHLQQGGASFRLMEGARHLQALRGVASILVGSPHRLPCAGLPQRGSASDVPGGQPCFYEILTRLKSQTGQTAEVLAARFLGVTPAGGAQALGDRLSNPARVASRRGFSCGIAENRRLISQSLLPTNRVSSPRPTLFAARCLGAPRRAATAWP